MYVHLIRLYTSHTKEKKKRGEIHVRPQYIECYTRQEFSIKANPGPSRRAIGRKEGRKKKEEGNYGTQFFLSLSLLFFLRTSWIGGLMGGLLYNMDDGGHPAYVYAYGICASGMLKTSGEDGRRRNYINCCWGRKSWPRERSGRDVIQQTPLVCANRDTS